MTNSHTSFIVDRACYTLGATLSGELQEAEGKTAKATKKKREQILRRWFPEASEDISRKSERRFRDPGSNR